MAPINPRELNRATLARQGLLEPIRAHAAAHAAAQGAEGTAQGAAQAVERLGSLQGQHPEWPPMALASRTVDATTADLAGAIERRTVVRSSLMRNTIHVVSAVDLWPMFAVCQPLRLNQWRLLMKADPLDSALGRRLTAAHEIAIAALRERPRSSLELDRLIADEVGLEATAVSRSAWRQPDVQVVVRAAWRHFSAFHCLVHVPHDGEGYGRSRYALATDWLGEERPALDEAMARVHVARRYLAAFGPASVDDLVAYVGRGKAGIGAWREAIDAIGDETVTLHDDRGRTLHDLDRAPRPPADTLAPPKLLARWDSLLLSHAAKHRDRVISDELRPAVYSKNADVRPTFLIDGMVAGTWELSRSGDLVAIVVRPATALDERDRVALEMEAMRLLAVVEPRAPSHQVTFTA
ncbi:MAG: winged helix DNA-binding domain-containing protein [Candidatus Limnocylindria bacterium]